MDEHEELVRYVVNDLKRQQNIENVLIPEIVEKTGWNWPTSERFIKQVQEDHGVEISIFTQQFYLYLGWGIIAFGIILVLVMYEATFGLGTLIECINMDIQGHNGTPFDFMSCSGWLNAGYLQSFSNIAWIGLLMVIGGVIGVCRALIMLHSNTPLPPVEN